jgi:hypothetical protein
MLFYNLFIFKNLRKHFLNLKGTLWAFLILALDISLFSRHRLRLAGRQNSLYTCEYLHMWRRGDRGRGACSLRIRSNSFFIWSMHAFATGLPDGVIFIPKVPILTYFWMLWKEKCKYMKFIAIVAILYIWGIWVYFWQFWYVLLRNIWQYRSATPTQSLDLHRPVPVWPDCEKFWHL